MSSLKSAIKAMLPERILLWYHASLAVFANIVYGRPSERLIVIGITGTKGKSTVSSMVWSILQASGMKTGVLSTAVIRIGDQQWMNPYKMTMPGRFQVQKWLRRMVREGCQAAVLETTSQGIVQFRHIGVNYDVAALTNLYPEHIESHGSFAAYVTAKERLFLHLSRRPHKWLTGVRIPKSIVVNARIEQSAQFLAHPADQYNQFAREGTGDITTADIAGWKLPLPGIQNVENVLAAVSIARALHIPDAVIRQGIESLGTVPGRMEEFRAAGGFTVVVDYAHEPVSLELLYKTYREKAQQGRLICVIGSAGGGRDTSRRPKMGEVAGRLCDQVVVTNEDPYDDDPGLIIQQVAAGASAVGKQQNIDLHIVSDRRQAIAQAIAMAKPGDYVLCSGKGSEQAIVVAGGKKIPWDERRVVEELLQK